MCLQYDCFQFSVFKRAKKYFVVLVRTSGYVLKAIRDKSKNNIFHFWRHWIYYDDHFLIINWTFRMMHKYVGSDCIVCFMFMFICIIWKQKQIANSESLQIGNEWHCWTLKGKVCGIDSMVIEGMCLRKCFIPRECISIAVWQFFCVANLYHAHDICAVKIVKTPICRDSSAVVMFKAASKCFAYSSPFANVSVFISTEIEWNISSNMWHWIRMHTKCSHMFFDDSLWTKPVLSNEKVCGWSDWRPLSYPWLWLQKQAILAPKIEFDSTEAAVYFEFVLFGFFTEYWTPRWIVEP